VLYFFLKRLFNSSESAVLFLLSFAFVFQAFFSHVALGIIMCFIVISALKNQRWIDYTWIGLGTIVLILWRIDSGWAALVATLLFMPVLFFIYRCHPNLKNALKGFSIVFFTLLVGFLISFLIRNPEQIIENLQASLHYFGASQAHGFSKIASSFPHQFYIYHFLLPFVGLVIVIGLIYQIRKRDLWTNNQEILPGLLSIFFLLLYLTNAQRGLVRHSFLVGTEAFLSGTFYVGLSLFITFLLEQKRVLFSRYVTFFSSLAVVYLVLKFFPLGNHETLFSKTINDPGIENFDLKLMNAAGGQRTIPDSTFIDNYYLDLKMFMDENFNSDATFLDFTNSPMLYFYCKRKIPGYFNQNLQNTVDDFLQLNYLKYVDPVKVPIVIFSNLKPNWFDATDGVPNVMRYYLIAEYIFDNYEPYAIINQKNIWIAKGTKLNKEYDFPKTSFDLVKRYDYKKAAFYVGEYYKHNSSNYLDTVFIQNEFAEYVSGKYMIDLPNLASHLRHSYIRIRIDAETDFDKVGISLFSGEVSIGHFEFDVIKGGYKYYYFRTGNHYLSYLHNINKLTIEVRPGIYIKEITILKDNRFENE
jgi:hypothetical protein